MGAADVAPGGPSADNDVHAAFRTQYTAVHAQVVILLLAVVPDGEM